MDIIAVIKRLCEARKARDINMDFCTTAEIVHYGMEYARKIERKNDNWDIVWAIPMPKKEGERFCEIVIGDRHTRFQPYVAWHCFDMESYAWGHYENTFAGDLLEALSKCVREIGEE